jgi:hypothetical protein
MKPKTRQAIPGSEAVGHYHRSVDRIVNLEQARERLFLLFSACLFLLTLGHSNAPLLLKLSEALREKYLGQDVPLGLSVIVPALWIAATYFNLKYQQTLVHIENAYTYVHSLEVALAERYEKPFFSQEGRGYERSKNAFRDYVWVFYRYLVPIISLIVVGRGIVYEWNRTECISFTLIIALLLEIQIVIGWWSAELNPKLKLHSMGEE